MLFRFQVCLFLCLALTCHLAGGVSDPYQQRLLRIYDLTYEREPFTAIVIQPFALRREIGFWGMDSLLHDYLSVIESLRTRLYPGYRPTFLSPRAGLSANDLAETLLVQGQEWLLGLYDEKKKFSKDAKGWMREAFQKSESILRRNSSVVILIKRRSVESIVRDGLGEVHSLLRIVALSSPDDLAPMEERLVGTKAEARFARLEPEFRMGTELIWIPHENGRPDVGGSIGRTLGLTLVPLKNSWWYGASAEAKNFSRRKNLILPMLEVGVAHGFLSRSPEAIPKNHPNNRRLETITTGGVLMNPWLGGELMSRIGQVVLECDDEGTHEYFLRRGFTDIRPPFENPHMPGSYTYWMEASIEDVHTKVLPSYAGNLPRSKATTLKLRASNFIRAQSCAGELEALYVVRTE